jgi:hypothetical protein
MRGSEKDHSAGIFKDIRVLLSRLRRLHHNLYMSVHISVPKQGWNYQFNNDSAQAMSHEDDVR